MYSEGLEDPVILWALLPRMKALREVLKGPPESCCEAEIGHP